MRIRNLKTHLISIGIISAVVVVIYVLFAPASIKSGRGGELQGDHYIQIDSASWGLNCNPYVDEALRNWKPDAKVANNPKPHTVMPDNALSPVSEACNGKLTCSFIATPEFIGDDPLPACPKKLALRWRCFTFDQLMSKEFGSGATIAIDCTPKADPTSGPANAH